MNYFSTLMPTGNLAALIACSSSERDSSGGKFGSIPGQDHVHSPEKTTSTLEQVLAGQHSGGPQETTLIPRVDYESYQRIRAQIDALDNEGVPGMPKTLDVHVMADIPGEQPRYVNELVTRGPNISISTRPIKNDFLLSAKSPDEITGYRIFSGAGLHDRYAGGFIVHSTDRQLVKALHEELVRRTLSVGSLEEARASLVDDLETHYPVLIDWIG